MMKIDFKTEAQRQLADLADDMGLSSLNTQVSVRSLKNTAFSGGDLSVTVDDFDFDFTAHDNSLQISFNGDESERKELTGKALEFYYQGEVLKAEIVDGSVSFDNVSASKLEKIMFSIR